MNTLDSLYEQKRVIRNQLIASLTTLGRELTTDAETLTHNEDTMTNDRGIVQAAGFTIDTLSAKYETLRRIIISLEKEKNHK